MLGSQLQIPQSSDSNWPLHWPKVGHLTKLVQSAWSSQETTFWLISFGWVSEWVGQADSRKENVQRVQKWASLAQDLTFDCLWNDFADFPGSLLLHLSSFLNLNHSTACWLRKNYFTLFLNDNHGLTNSLTDRVWCKKCRFLSWSLQFSGKDRLRKKKTHTHTQNKKLKQVNKRITSCVKRENRVLS